MANQDIGDAAETSVILSDMTPADLVVKFLLDNKIQRAVIDEVLERGLDSLEALSLLDPEDIKTQKIPVGQRRLLLYIAKSLGTQGQRSSALIGSEACPNIQTRGSGSTPVNQPATMSTTHRAQPTSLPTGTEGINTDVYQQTLMNSLITQQAQLAGRQSGTPMGASAPIRDTSDNGHPQGLDSTQPTWQNPQIHIATATGKSSSLHYDICDFVPHSVEEELVIGGQGEQQVVVKSGPKKPKLENLSLSQWSIANLAILYKLTSEGKLVGPALMDYLSYTTKIYQMVQKCSLSSVLLYDREYRQLQASMGFRWGTDVQHLHMLHLQPRDKQVRPGTQSQNQKRGASSSATQSAKSKGDNRDTGICRNYNSDKGCTFPKCRFIHQCILPGCTEKHPGTAHLKKN